MTFYIPYLYWGDGVYCFMKGGNEKVDPNDRESSVAGFEHPVRRPN